MDVLLTHVHFPILKACFFFTVFVFVFVWCFLFFCLQCLCLCCVFLHPGGRFFPVPSPSSVFPTDIAVNVTTVITVFGSNLQLGDGSDFVVVDSETSCDGHSSVTGLSSFSVGPLVKVGDNLQVSLSGVVKGSFVSCIRVPGIENYSSLQPRLVVQGSFSLIFLPLRDGVMVTLCI